MCLWGRASDGGAFAFRVATQNVVGRDSPETTFRKVGPLYLQTLSGGHKTQDQAFLGQVASVQGQ